jgi:hypothetical protein
MSYEEVVFNRSYINIILLNRSIPSWDNPDKKEDEGSDKKEDEGSDKKRKEEIGTCKPINKSIHASDFFMNMMG